MSFVISTVILELIKGTLALGAFLTILLAALPDRETNVDW